MGGNHILIVRLRENFEREKALRSEEGWTHILDPHHSFSLHGNTDS